MQEVRIPIEIVQKCREEACQIGRLNPDVLPEGGTVEGLIGEWVALQVIGGYRENDYDHDLRSPCGKRIEVKTQKCKSRPLPSYLVNLAVKDHGFQDCDAYAFVRLRNDFEIGWFLGVKNRNDYLNNAKRFEKGSMAENGKFAFVRDCMCMPIADLDDASHVIRGVMQWQAYVANGGDYASQRKRYEEVPDEYKARVASHMKTYRQVQQNAEVRNTQRKGRRFVETG